MRTYLQCAFCDFKAPKWRYSRSRNKSIKVENGERDIKRHHLIKHPAIKTIKFRILEADVEKRNY